MLGHLLYDLAEEQYELAVNWFKSADIYEKLQTIIAKKVSADGLELEHMLDEAMTIVVQAWESDAGIKTFPQAVADRIQLLQEDGQDTAMSVDEWMAYAKKASHYHGQAEG